ncbi:F-box protein PP2-B15 [Senna tora]|uniref:F-box protein PP2-B15 n=1 Tax=Senna tora TaxID=362788 RepID=A0A834TA29_9FABA|nr:F-box protein PP2-B15 [Senna tora]
MPFDEGPTQLPCRILLKTPKHRPEQNRSTAGVTETGFGKNLAVKECIDSLPEECVSMILSYTSPPDASRCSFVSSAFRSAALSDTLWLTFLPSDYYDIVSRASFQLDKCSGKKSYILSATQLSVTWGSDPLLWSWRPMPEAEFEVVGHLRTVSWLEIKGEIRSGILSPNTWYGAYLVMKVSHRAYGLECAASEVSVEVGDKVVEKGRAYLSHKDEKDSRLEKLFYGNRREMLRKGEDDIRVPLPREDGWMEIEIGQFYSGEQDEEVKMSVMEVGYQLKGGLILEGIDIRPKH